MKGLSHRTNRGASHPHHSSFFMGSPPFFSALSPFYTSIHFPFFIYVSVFPRLWVITRPINPYVRVVGKNWIAWYEYGLVRCWAPHYGVGSFLPCTALALSVLFFRRFYEVLNVRSSSATSLGLQGAFIARPRQ